MENYKELQRLGKGAQGAAYLADNILEGKKYVLKKVECQDESEANKAYKEAILLHDMQHPYICGYNEFFVHWDKEDSAMYVCIVMDYYSNGDLDRVLRIKRADRDNIEEAIVKKWLGQILEALLFAHKNKVIHRDLKPSNVYMQDDLSVAIGDFGVPTVMADVRTKTRSKIGTMNWMAPEVLEQPYDEKSDVWSLGCIALEMTTCSCYDTAQMSGQLFEIKHNPQALEDSLAEVSKSYSSELVSAIRTMLDRNQAQRPATRELLEIPYLKECLELSNTALAERRKRQQSDAASKPLPKGKGMTIVTDYLLENINNESCVKSVLEYLAELTKEEEGRGMEDRVKRLVVKAMRENMLVVEAQIAGCHILNNLIVNAKSDDILYTRDMISVVPLAMKSHSGSSQLQQAASMLLMAFSGNEHASEVIGQTGGISDILAAMKKFSNNAELNTTCCNALWSLCVNENNAKMLTEEDGFRTICNAMITHSDCPDLIEGASAAILSLSMEEENIKIIHEVDCVGLLIDAIQTHMAVAKVVKNACMALAGLVEPDEESAFKVLTNERPGESSVQGIPIIQKAYNTHKDNAEVVENICVLFSELLEYDEVREDLRLLRFVETILLEIWKRYKENMDIIKPCEAALTKLGNEKILKQTQAGIRKMKLGRS